MQNSGEERRKVARMMNVQTKHNESLDILEKWYSFLLTFNYATHVTSSRLSVEIFHISSGERRARCAVVVKVLFGRRMSSNVFQLQRGVETTCKVDFQWHQKIFIHENPREMWSEGGEEAWMTNLMIIYSSSRWFIESKSRLNIEQRASGSETGKGKHCENE